MDERLRLVVELQNRASAELKKLSREMGGVKPTAGMTSAASWFTQLEGASAASTKAMRPLVGGLNMVGAGGLAAGLSVAGLVGQFRDLAKALPALQELSRLSGISKTEIERLKYAAQNLNVDPSKMSAAIGTWSASMVDFQRQTGHVYAEMQNGAAGLAEKIRKEYASNPAAALQDQLKWLAEIPAAQMRAGKSTQEAAQIQRYWVGQVLGDEGMAQIFSKGPQGWQDAVAKAAREVTPITDELVRQSEAFNQSINAFDRSWQNLKQDLGTTVLPGLTAATDGLRKLFDEVKKDPELLAIGAGAVGAMAIRRRIMRSGGGGGAVSSAAAAKIEGAAVEQKGASASFAEAVAEFRAGVREMAARGGTPGGPVPAEPVKPGVPEAVAEAPKGFLGKGGFKGVGGSVMEGLFGAMIYKVGEEAQDWVLGWTAKDQKALDHATSLSTVVEDVRKQWLGGGLRDGRVKDDAYVPPPVPTAALSSESYWVRKKAYLDGRAAPQAPTAFRTPAAYDREQRARAAAIPTAFAQRDLLDTVRKGSKEGIIAGLREMAQQQDLDPNHDGKGGVGAPSLRFGRDPASGGYRRGGHSGGGRGYADTPDGQGRAGDVKGGEGIRAMAAMKYLVEKKGWTPEGAAEAVGNAMQESQVSSRGGVGDPNVPGGSHKMFQWNNGPHNDTVNGRWARFQAFARAQGKTVDDFETNLDFMDEERKHRSGLEAQWHKQTDLHNAGRLSHLFEGYGDRSEGTRVQNARNMLDLWKKQHPGAAHAAGGPIRGPGGPRSDSIPAWLSDGEYVINAASAHRYLPLLHAINGDHLPAYANGGPVGFGVPKQFYPKSSPGISDGEGHDNRRSWRDFFRRPRSMGGMGASWATTLGAVAMMQGESGRGLNTKLYGWDVNGLSGGVDQLHDVTTGKYAGKLHRLSDLMTYAMQQHVDWQDRTIQQANFRKEATGSMAFAWQAMSHARTSADALRKGINLFENPANHALEFARRLPNIAKLEQEDRPQSTRVAHDPVEITVRHHPNGRTSVAGRAGRGVTLALQTAPTMVRTR